MHPEKLGFEDCDLNSIFKVIDKETQTNVSNTIQGSDSSSKTYKLPLPRELEKTEEGTIKVFSFCQIIQDPECPTSITIVRESVTEEVHSHSNTPNDEAFSNRYRYCKEVIKPYLRDYPPDCPDSGELLLRDAIITANEEFPDYPPCYEIPNPEAKKPDETKKPEQPHDETKKPEKPRDETKKPEQPRDDTKKPEKPPPETKKPEEPHPDKKPEESRPEKKKPDLPCQAKKSQEQRPDTKKPEDQVKQEAQYILCKDKPCKDTSKSPKTPGEDKPCKDTSKSPKTPGENKPSKDTSKSPKTPGEDKPCKDPSKSPKTPGEDKPSKDTSKSPKTPGEDKPCKDPSKSPRTPGGLPPEKSPKTSGEIPPEKSQKPVEEKKERRHLVLCPNEKVPKICIEITDPQICQEILKKQKLLKKEQQEKEAKKAAEEGGPKLSDDKGPKKDVKEPEGKRTEEDSRKASDDKRTPQGSGKDVDDKRSKKDSCVESESKCREESDDKRPKEGARKESDDKHKEDSRLEKPKKRPCIRKSEKKPRPEDPEYKGKPPTESQKSSHPEKPKQSLPPVPPKQPKEEVCQPEEEEYCPEDLYPPDICPLDDDDDHDDGCYCCPEEVKDEPRPPKRNNEEKEIAVLPKQDKKPPKSDKSGWPSNTESKPCPNKKDLSPFPQRKDCLLKLLDTIKVNPKNEEVCRRKPITPKKMDGSSETTPNKKCASRPKSPPTVTSVPVDKCVKESTSDRKLCKPKSSKCDVRKGQPTKDKSETCHTGKKVEESGPKAQAGLDDGRCYCEKDGVKGQTVKPDDPSKCKSAPGKSQNDQKTGRPIHANTAKMDACQSVNGKPVKTALQAHNETMATLKCAMEDFMCKVFRSTQDAVTLITTESAKRLEKFRKSSSNTDCPPPKKVSDTRSNRENLRRFSVVNIDSSPKDLPDCIPPDSNDSKSPSKYLDELVKKVDSAFSIISDTIAFDVPRPVRPSNFNDTSSKYDIPISSRPLPKDIENISNLNISNPPTTSSMLTTIKDTLWSMFCDDEKSEKGSVSKASSNDSASSESDEDLLHKMID